MDEYLQPALADLQERIRQLKGLIPPNLGRDVATLERTCRDLLDRAVAECVALGDGATWVNPRHSSIRMRRYRRVVEDIAWIESTGINALQRWQATDDRLNRLIERIAREIHFPLPSPVVACLAQAHYEIDTKLGLLVVPPADGLFLLHLPDVYHELSHLLLDEESDARLAPLQDAYLRAWNAARSYLRAELRVESNQTRRPESFKLELRAWMESWRAWTLELFCDAFAAATLGPAYAWSHLHLTAKSDAEMFAVPKLLSTSHPCAAARMELVLQVLQLGGFGSDVIRVRTRWEELVASVGGSETPSYRRCYPSDILLRVAQEARSATQTVGCVLADPAAPKPIEGVFSAAWDEFWNAPADFADWEARAARELGLRV
jgi:hypothetical protein